MARSRAAGTLSARSSKGSCESRPEGASGIGCGVVHSGGWCRFDDARVDAPASRPCACDIAEQFALQKVVQARLNPAGGGALGPSPRSAWPRWRSLRTRTRTAGGAASRSNLPTGKPGASVNSQLLALGPLPAGGPVIVQPPESLPSNDVPVPSGSTMSPGLGADRTHRI